MDHVDHKAGTHRYADERVHPHLVAVQIVQLLKILFEIAHIHLGALGQTVELETEHLDHVHILRSPFESRHSRDKPFRELLDGSIHGLLFADKLQLHLHLVQWRIHRETLTDRDTQLIETLKLAEKLILLLHDGVLRHLGSHIYGFEVGFGIQVLNTVPGLGGSHVLGGGDEAGRGGGLGGRRQVGEIQGNRFHLWEFGVGGGRRGRHGVHVHEKIGSRNVHSWRVLL